jgi:hypothetical protein
VLLSAERLGAGRSLLLLRRRCAAAAAPHGLPCACVRAGAGALRSDVRRRILICCDKMMLCRDMREREMPRVVSCVLLAAPQHITAQLQLSAFCSAAPRRRSARTRHARSSGCALRPPGRPRLPAPLRLRAAAPSLCGVRACACGVVLALRCDSVQSVCLLLLLLLPAPRARCLFQGR